MSFLSPLHPVFESKLYPHARTYRGTFGTKMYDTYSFWGGTLLLGLDDADKAHAGVFDYLTLGIPYLVGMLAAEFFRKVLNRGSLPAKIFLLPLLGLAAVVSLVPRYIFAGIMTLISLPFVAIAHGISTFKGDRLKGTILSYEVSTVDANNKPLQTTWGSLLQAKGMQLEEITRFKQDPDINRNLFKLTFAQGSKELSLDLMLRGSKKDATVYEAFKELNIGGIQSTLENLPAPKM